MDNATGGDNDKESAMQVSADMENITGNGGFQFKETVGNGSTDLWLYTSTKLKIVNY